MMAARLILNADDFGLTRGINRAIAELHAAGALTSATLMANGPAFDDAVTIALANPTLGVGCHIVLTDGTPVSPPETIPSLVGADGKNFRPNVTDFFLAALRGKLSAGEIQHEALTQIQKLQRTGINVTHVDTHKHTHVLPRIALPLLAAAENAGVRAIRNPFEERWSLALGNSPLITRLKLRILHSLRPRFFALPQIRDRRILTTDGTIGISATGSLDATTLRTFIDALPNGLWEMVCHPGYNDRELDAVTTRLRETRETEREALLTVFGSNSLNPSVPHLIHYAELTHSTNP
jgi:hopanoid biosynthesis associated protein HpnK